MAVGAVLCVIAATALPWARAYLSWRSVLLGGDIELGTYSFKLLENPWLAAAAISIAVLCAAGLFWRRQAGTAAVIGSVLLLACSTAYLVSLVKQAYDFLGFYKNVLDLVRSFPMIGPLVESVIRERLQMSALPHAGMILFFAASFIILAGGSLILRRNRKWRPLALPPPPGPR